MESVLWTPSFFNEIREKCHRYEWADNALRQLVRQTETFVETEPEFPLTGGGWSHNYNCPNDGARLTLIDMHHHKCPACGSVWSGTPWDEVAVSHVHGRNSMNCRNAAVLLGITGDAKWAERAKQVLLFYAEHYDQYPLHDRHGGAGVSSGKVQCQTLSEASWLAPLAQAYAILKQQGILSPREQSIIAEKLLLAALAVIGRNPMGISNWQSYHNAARALVAAAIGDRALMEQAVYDPENGFMFQMENSLGEDGFWYEGAWGYHFYALEAQVMIALAALSFDLHLYENRRFQAMFQAPLNCMFPDGTLPAVHDSAEVQVGRYAHLFEFSAAFFGIGEKIVQESERTSLYSLLFGASKDTLETGEPARAHEFVQLKRSGMVFLRWGAESRDRQQIAMIDYGEHGGWHGHQDKLNLLYYAKGHPWLNDAGMLPYGNPMHERFFKQTVAHNTVAVGRRSQAPAEGALRLARTDGSDRMEAVASVEGTYPGVSMRRKIVMTDSLLFDVFYVRCEREQDVDWIVHTEGIPLLEQERQWTATARQDGCLGLEDGYSFLKEIKKLETNQALTTTVEWQWDREGHASDRFMLYAIHGHPGEEMYMAESLAMPNIKRRSTFIRRRRGVKETVFVALFRPYRQTEAPIQLHFEPERSGGPREVIVEYEGGGTVRFSTDIEAG